MIINMPYTILWSTVNLPDNLKIELTRDDQDTWETISESTPNTGSYVWNVTVPVTNRARFRISDIEYPEINAVTNLFTIEHCVLPVTFINTNSGVQLSL